MSEYSKTLTKSVLGWTLFYIFLVLVFGYAFQALKLLPYYFRLPIDARDNYIFLNLDFFYRKETYITGLLFTIFSVLMYMVFNPTSAAKRRRIMNSKSKAVETNLENSRWMSDEEREETFPKCRFNKLSGMKKDGIPVRAEYKGGDIHINLASPMHVLIIGATGSGKTTTFINPMIQILAHSSAGSSMIVTDPKGELFQMHSKLLKDRGYDCMVLDLRDAYSSFRWNPLDPICDSYQRYIDEGKVLYKRRDKAADSGLKLMNNPDEYGEVWHEYDGRAYANVEQLISEIKVAKQKHYDEAYEDLNDLCSVLCPVESKDDPVWEKGAKSIIMAILLAMLEDLEDPELNFTREKLCFFNVNKALSNSENNFEELKRYFCGRSPLSKAVTLSRQVLSAADTTLASYMSIAFDKMSMFNDEGLCSLTSTTDIDPMGIAEKPTALFLKIPDEKDTRHPLAAVFVLSIYKALIKKASSREDLSLPRNVYMILDEFGNMPKIDKFDKMITVGRSRKIWFNMVVQSYAQLENVYTKVIADIIKSNCGIKMFIGSNDIETCKEFSELCGNMTVQTSSVSSGTGDKGGDVSVSQQVQTRALIYPSELQKLNNQKVSGNSIIVTFGNYPLKTYFTPSYKCPLYEFGIMDLTEAKSNAFFGDRVYYHLPTRNSTLENRMKAQQEQSGAAALQQEAPKEDASAGESAGGENGNQDADYKSSTEAAGYEGNDNVVDIDYDKTNEEVKHETNEINKYDDLLGEDSDDDDDFDESELDELLNDEEEEDDEDNTNDRNEEGEDKSNEDENNEEGEDDEDDGNFSKSELKELFGNEKLDEVLKDEEFNDLFDDDEEKGEEIREDNEDEDSVNSSKEEDKNDDDFDESELDELLNDEEEKDDEDDTNGRSEENEDKNNEDENNEGENDENDEDDGNFSKSELKELFGNEKLDEVLKDEEFNDLFDDDEERGEEDGGGDEDVNKDIEGEEDEDESDENDEDDEEGEGGGDVLKIATDGGGDDFEDIDEVLEEYLNSDEKTFDFDGKDLNDDTKNVSYEDDEDNANGKSKGNEDEDDESETDDGESYENDDEIKSASAESDSGSVQSDLNSDDKRTKKRRKRSLERMGRKSAVRKIDTSKTNRKNRKKITSN